MSVLKITPGDVVWAPYKNRVTGTTGEHRFRVVSVDLTKGQVTLKHPGDDGGTFTVSLRETFPSNGQPSTVQETQ